MERRADREADPVVDQIEGVSSQPKQVASGENLSEVSASVSDLMAPEKHKTLFLRPSVVSANTIEFYISKGYFKEEECRPSGVRPLPSRRRGEAVVFRDFFTAGLRLPVDPIVPKLLAPFNAKLHHFTPNAMVQMSKFIWVVRTF